MHRIFQTAIVCGLALSSAPAASRDDFAREMVSLHNDVRARVGTPPLHWSDRLAAHAQRWANHLAEDGAFEHSKDSPYGENLFEITGAAATPGQVIDSWASEAKGYDYGRNSCRGVCGHYTQLVWRTTKEVGCAKGARRNAEVWVCNYDPPGNYIGERPY